MLNLCRLIFLPDRRAARSPEWFANILLRFTLGAVRIVTGINSLLIFGDRALALSADVKNLSEIDVGPDLDPLRLQIAIQDSRNMFAAA